VWICVAFKKTRKSTAIFVRKLTTSNMEETMTVSDAGDILLVENRSPAV
jgi:hypothetical protein